jgi:glycosyltransferase involved in cell wall biosynthesis
MSRLLFDLTGLLHWYAYFRRPGGVQRVIEKLAGSEALCRSGEVEFVSRVLGGDRFLRVDPGLLGNVDALRRFHALALRQASPAGLLAEARYFHWPYLARGWTMRDGASPQLVPPPAAGDLLFSPGDLWWQKKYAARVGALKARTGVRIAQMIHDLYLIDRPEWTPSDAVRVFGDQLRGIAPVVDRWLVTSQFMTGRLERYLAERSLPARPIAILPMGWDSLAVPGAGSRPIVDQPYILFVGTIEPRKNLPALLNAMDELRAQLADRLPRLVFVGGRGWMARGVRPSR